MRAALGLLFLCAGCVTSTTTLQTARTVPPGEFRGGAAFALPISTRFVGEVVDLIDQVDDSFADAVDEGRALTTDEQREAIESLAGIVLLMPAPVFELNARVGLAKDVDIGLRWAGPALETGVKWHFYEQPGFDLAATLDYTYHTGVGASIASAVYDIAEQFDLASYSRHDLELAVIASGDPEATVTPYGAVRYLAGFTSFESVVEEIATESGAPRTDTSAVMHHFGAAGGIRIGTPSIHLMLELTVLYVAFAPTVFGADIDLSGLVITPAIGFAFETS